jgi:predicted Fe-S protein YdhL (DUF1289 family)
VNASHDAFDVNASPCIGECRLDQEMKTCLGCLRTMDEIERWAGLGPDQRREMLRTLEDRRRNAI